MNQLKNSVWEGDDRSFLEQAIDFYLPFPVTTILDCTVNTGKFRKGSRYANLVLGMDIDPDYEPDVVDDNRRMETIEDKSFDVVVYDPPHLPNQGKDRTKDFRQQFGLGEKSNKCTGYSLSHDYPLVMKQASRVLKKEGICLCKITDYIHNHCYHWTLVDLVGAIQAANMMPCDLIIKVRKGPIVDPKWKTRHHVRKTHCYWVVARNSSHCERKTVRKSGKNPI